MNLGIGLGLTNYLRVPTVALDPDAAISDLFQTGTPGVYYEGAWYDPSDSTTVFQDAAGTTPATVGDPVGLILDKSKGGVSATNQMPATSASDWTVYGANTISDEADGSVLITYVDNADGGFIRISNFYAGLLDTSVSHIIKFDAKVSTGSVQVRLNGETPVASQNLSSTSYQEYTFAVKWDGVTAIMSLQALGMGAGESVNIKNIRIYEAPGNHATQTTSAARPILQQSGATPVLSGTELVTNGTFDTDTTGWSFQSNATGSVVSSELEVILAGSSSRAAYQDLATVIGEYYQLSLTARSASGQILFGAFTTSFASIQSQTVAATGSNQQLSLTFKATTTTTRIVVSQAETGSTETYYADNISVQEVTSWSGGLRYLDFDGVDDNLSTASIDFTASDQMTTAAAVERQNTTAGAIAELSANWNSNTGTFLFFTGTGTNGVGNGFAAASRGTASASGTQFAYTTAIYTPPARAVLVGLHDISDDYTKIRFDGTDSFVATGDKGLGNFSNNPIYFGARGGTTIPFDGLFFGVVIVNRTLLAEEISDLESYLATKSGVTL